MLRERAVDLERHLRADRGDRRVQDAVEVELRVMPGAVHEGDRSAVLERELRLQAGLRLRTVHQLRYEVADPQCDALDLVGRQPVLVPQRDHPILDRV